MWPMTISPVHKALRNRFQETLTRCALALLALSLFSAITDAQRLQTQRIDERAGMPDVRVTDLAQDESGRIWFSTQSGIFAYDGTVWDEYKFGGELSSNFVPMQIALGETGRVWSLPSDRKLGLGLFEGGLWRSIPIPQSSSGTRTSGQILCLGIQDGRERIAIANPEGVLLLDGDHWSQATRDPECEGHKISTMESWGSHVYIGGSYGLEVMRPEQEFFEPLYQLDTSDGPIKAIDVEDAGGHPRIWMVTNQWIGCLEEGKLSRFPITSGPLQLTPNFHSFMVSDGSGTIHIGTVFSAWRFDRETRELAQITKNDGLVSGGTTGIMRDREGNIWVSSRRGVTLIPPQQFSGFDRNHGLLDDEVSALEELAPDVFLLGHNTGLSLLESGVVTQTILFDLTGEKIFDMTRVLDLQRDPDGGCWIAAGALGLGHWSRAEGLKWLDSAARHHCCSVMYDANGVLWASTENMICEVRDGKLLENDATYRAMGARRLFSCPQGTLYAALRKGGLALKTEGGWRTVTAGEGTQGLDVFSTFVTSSGRTLIGSAAGLLELIDDQVEPVVAPYAVGAPVYAILQDAAENLWLGTGHGLYCWDGEELHQYRIRDGLLGNEVNRAALIEDSKGNLWVGTNGGLSLFNRRLLPKQLPPKLNILDMRSAGETIQLGQHIKLESYTDVEFQIRSASFSNGGAPIMRARLVGFDQEWLAERPIGSGQLRYTHLPPGDYHLEVQARVERSAWSPIASTPVFSIKAPFWQAWWFLSLCSSGLIFLCFLLAGFFYALKRSLGLELEVQRGNAALSESEQRYREMFEKNPSIQLLLEPRSGLILEANAAAAEYFGNTIEELREQSFSDLTGIDQEVLSHGLSRFQRVGDLVIHSAEEHSAFGPPIEIRASHYPLGGRKVVQVTVYDIEEKTRLEQQLREAQKLQAVGALANGVAHDFNNLLTAILGHNELIEMDNEGEDLIQEHIDHIRSAGERGASLVKKLLAFGRRQILCFEELNLNDVITEVSVILKSALGSKIQVVLDLDDFIGSIRADRHQLERSLINLTLNARDAMPNGGTLTVRTGLSEIGELKSELPSYNPEFNYVKLSIIDTGQGMNAEECERAFEPFFTSKGGENSGLGLSMVHGFIGQCGGVATVESAPDEGTSIHIFLPSLARWDSAILPAADDELNLATSHWDAGEH
ncbi:MAG: PAS domain S-box-containing protein [Planctomycetota bacterium]|jgi:PAS domain S-box-containing protein